MTKKLLKSLMIAAVSLGLVLTLVASFISFSNREVELRNTFEQKMDERTAFYDKMFKVISQKTQIAVKNDSSFMKVVDAQVQGQKNGEQVMWAWVQQSNPAATFTEVTKLYADLSRAVEGERASFFEQEKILQDVQRQHKNLVQKVPGNIFNAFLDREPLKYSPIQSDRTVEVMRTGKDNNVKLDM